jgi:type I restriction enzyme M protein
MAQLNVAIHHVTADVALGDVFGEDQFPQLRADRVIAVPPWNQKLPVLDSLTEDPRWVWGEPASNDGNAAWVQHCISHLADDGRAVLVLPNSALFEGGRAGRIRQRIVKAGLLEAVLALPPGLFSWTALSCAVLVFAKGRSNAGGGPLPTLMIDLTEAASDQSGRAGTLKSNVIDEVTAIYRNWVRGQHPTAEYAAVASFEDLVGNDFVIDPGRYLSLQRTPLDLDKASLTQSELSNRLDVLTQASHEADAKLLTILGIRR